MSAKCYTFMNLFSAGDKETDNDLKLRTITIPIIQRDYAQGRIGPEVSRVRSRFLDSLYEAITARPITLDFIYGDIDEDGVMTPLDGQQRLTTLFLLHWYAARKENVPEDQCGFLHNFSYETRYSARDFCRNLSDFTPNAECFTGNGRRLSAEIEDQAWFPLDWKKDPTIHSMLVMLDAIQEKFCDVPSIWKKLQEGAITFYFLPMHDMGLTDDLYIKMNSRGKPLSAFEHYKAEFERLLRIVDEGLARRIISEIDLQWTDLLWRYRNSGSNSEDDNVTDDEFLRYFRFVCDILCYRNGESAANGNDDEFDLLNRYFSAGNADVVNNTLTLERYFNCWLQPGGYDTPAEFLASFLSYEHEPGKIVIDKRRYDLDIFHDCLRHYSEKSGNGRQRLFPLNRLVLLYAITDYLQNQDRMSPEAFRRRIRIVNNLIQNSEDEISDRTDRNQIPAILQQVDSIILDGLVRNDLNPNFNVNQLAEEQEKLIYTKEHPESAETLFCLEDHPLLYGQISILGLSHLDCADRFASLFACDRDKVDCALMAIGDYGQQERNGWRWQYGSGSSKMASAWQTLFHRSSNAGFDRTSRILLRLLASAETETITDDLLQDIADRFLENCESRQQFPWRYYYIKYPACRPGRYGRWSTLSINSFGEDTANSADDGTGNDAENHSKSGDPQYMKAVLYAQWYESSNMYVPYLKEADEKHLSREHNGLRLVYDDRYIICANDSYIVQSNAKDSVLDIVYIPQIEAPTATTCSDSDSGLVSVSDPKNSMIDTQDRILLLKRFLERNGYANQNEGGSHELS